MNKKNIILLLLILLGILLVIFFYSDSFLSQDKSSESKKELEERYAKEYKEAFSDKVENGYFSFPEEKTVSFGVNKDLDKEIGKYENVAKEKEAKLMMEFEDGNGQEREVYVKKLELNDENISYVLRHYTDYIDNLDLSLTNYQFKFSIDKFKKDEYKKETNSGTILISNNNIYVIMSNDESVDSFLNIFKKQNDVDGKFLDYLKENKNVLERVKQKITNNEEKIIQAKQNVSKNIREFGFNLWDAYIVLNSEKLIRYYADNVWFYAGKEWLEEWSMDANIEKEHKFVEVGKNDLLDAYQNIKAGDFKEDLEGMQEIEEDAFEFYTTSDFIDICYSEDAESFFNHFKIQKDDIIMVVRLDDDKTCTVEGEFFAGEMRFWVIREIDGENKVVVDYTE